MTKSLCMMSSALERSLPSQYRSASQLTTTCASQVLACAIKGLEASTGQHVASLFGSLRVVCEAKTAGLTYEPVAIPPADLLLKLNRCSIVEVDNSLGQQRRLPN